jgi:hypothetical protein
VLQIGWVYILREMNENLKTKLEIQRAWSTQ